MDENGVVTPVAAGECVIKTSVVSASDANAEAEDKAVAVDAAAEENTDATQAEPTSEDAVSTEDSQDKPTDDIIAYAATKDTVKAAEVKAESTNKTSNNKGATSSSTSHAQPAPSQSGTTSTPSQSTTTPSQSGSTVNPTPAQRRHFPPAPSVPVP